MEPSKTSVKSYEWDEYFIRGLAAITDILEDRQKLKEPISVIHEIRLEQIKNQLELYLETVSSHFGDDRSVRDIDKFDSWIVVGFRRLLRLLQERQSNAPAMLPEKRFEIREQAKQLIETIDRMRS